VQKQHEEVYKRKESRACEGKPIKNMRWFQPKQSGNTSQAHSSNPGQMLDNLAAKDPIANQST
jgi:hypothetical protein